MLKEINGGLVLARKFFEIAKEIAVEEMVVVVANIVAVVVKLLSLLIKSIDQQALA